MGSKYTSQKSGRKMWQKLDRCLSNYKRRSVCSDCVVHLLSKESSDHAPLLGKFSVEQGGHGGALNSSQCGLLIIRTPLRMFAAKLKRLKATLIAWNRDHFGNVFKKVVEVENKLKEVEIKAETDSSNQTIEEFNSAKLNLNQILDCEEKFWRQRAKVKWLNEGDRNTKKFHASASVKRKRSKIFRIKNSNGDWVIEQNDIVAAGVAFFKDQFSSTHQHFDFPLVQRLIPKLITDNQDGTVAAVPNEEEIKSAVFNMNPEGAGGFNGQLYVACWDILKRDLIAAVQCFFYGYEKEGGVFCRYYS